MPESGNKCFLGCVCGGFLFPYHPVSLIKDHILVKGNQTVVSVQITVSSSLNQDIFIHIADPLHDRILKKQKGQGKTTGELRNYTQ
jgi:hypothetical protein